MRVGCRSISDQRDRIEPEGYGRQQMTFFAKSSFAKSYETKLNKTQQDLRLRMVTAD